MLGPRRRIASLASLVLIAAVLALYGKHVWWNFTGYTIDDAAISYAYANNIAEGHGFRLTPNSNPVEGFSNPLEVLMLVPCRWLGANLDNAAKALNVWAVVVAAGLMGLFLWRNLEGRARLWVPVPVAFAFLWPTFNHWIAAGLEGGLLCGLQMVSVLLLALPLAQAWRDDALAVVAVLLVLVRPEGIVYGTLAVLGRLFIPGRRWRCAGIFGVGCLLVLVARFALFLQWLPNTFYAKMNNQTTWQSGWGYARTFFVVYGLPYFMCGLPAFALLAPRTRVASLVALAQTLFAVVFAVIAGGDWMRHWRFMQAIEGPYWVLCGLGLLGVLTWRPLRFGAWVASTRSNLLLLSLLPMVFFGLHGWKQRVHTCATDHDLDMRRIAKVGTLYHKLGDQLDLGRPLLIADVDAGGMSFPPGIDVLDMGGLGDLTFGYDWTRRPTAIVDYFFDYRRPHTMHTHGGWVDGRPMHSLSPFDRQYRVMGQKLMDQLSVSWLTAIRADLVDPPAAPIMPVQISLGGILVLGFSSLPDPQGHEVLFIHALQAENAEPPALKVMGADGASHDVGWHSQQDVKHGPPGTFLLGVVRLPPASLPITIRPGEIQLTDWPSIEIGLNSAEALSRLPLFRLAGLPTPLCQPADLLAAYASAGARARGARLLADLCRGGLSRGARAALANEISREARSQNDAQDRYDALRVFESLGLPTSTFQMGLIGRARSTPYDEVAGAWADRMLKTPLPAAAQVRAGLAALVLGGQYDKAILTALARGFTTVPEARDPLCLSVKALGLQPYLLSQLRCPDRIEAHLRVLRQGFEDASDGSLHFDEAARGWLVSEPSVPRVGGQGQAMLFVPACNARPCPEMVWGPLAWPGRYFGALATGAKAGGTIVVEAHQGTRWVEIAHLTVPVNEDILFPAGVILPEVSSSEVRVRVSNRSHTRAMTVDALTFLDLD